LTISRSYTLTSLSTYVEYPKLLATLLPTDEPDFLSIKLVLTPEEASSLVVGQTYTFALQSELQQSLSKSVAHSSFPAFKLVSEQADSPNVQQSLAERRDAAIAANGRNYDRACTAAPVLADQTEYSSQFLLSSGQVLELRGDKPFTVSCDPDAKMVYRVKS